MVVDGYVTGGKETGFRENGARKSRRKPKIIFK